MVVRMVLYQWFLARIRTFAAATGLYGTICGLAITLLTVAALLVISLIPLYLSKDPSDALGEVYCIRNYSLVVGFQIPQYNTTFTVSQTSASASLVASPSQYTPNIAACVGPINVTIGENLYVTNLCTYRLLSIIYPVTPNGRVFNSYALSEACYRTLQSCSYDALLSSCLISDCVAAELVNTAVNASYPLTYYRLRCTANIYYKTRCLDSPSYYGLYRSSRQRNSVCRQQRMNRINTCFNSNVQLSNVPCMISVSSGLVTSASTVSCTANINSNSLSATISGFGGSNLTTFTGSYPPVGLASTFTSTIFAASDQTDGHAYRISSINSETYPSSQLGALYCGAVSLTQIASSITAAISSQSS